MMSSECYAQGRWIIDNNHGSKKIVATKMTEDLFGACPSVKVTMGDVSVDQNFFAHDRSTYFVILGQPYINVIKMETNVIDDGSAFVRMQNFFVQDGSTYPVILGQPYINVVRMETTMIDDYSTFVRIKSQDGRKRGQFLTMTSNRERNKEWWREHPVQKRNEEFFQDFG